MPQQEVPTLNSTWVGAGTDAVGGRWTDDTLTSSASVAVSASVVASAVGRQSTDTPLISLGLLRRRQRHRPNCEANCELLELRDAVATPTAVDRLYGLKTPHLTLGGSRQAATQRSREQVQRGSRLCTPAGRSRRSRYPQVALGADFKEKREHTQVVFFSHKMGLSQRSQSRLGEPERLQQAKAKCGD
jgi:hypothetical protein